LTSKIKLEANYLREWWSRWMWASSDDTCDLSVIKMACCLAFSTCASTHCLSLIPNLSWFKDNKIKN